jgi:FkbM family methyltransferase
MVTIETMKKLIPKPIKTALKQLISCATWDQWAQRSWSQEGEDQILRRIFERQSDGFYVDVGAHHPKRFSNTYLFYKRGWRGINIDAMLGSMRVFKKTRPRDINLEIGIGEQQGKLDYFVFNEPALNGFSRDLSDERNEADSAYRIESVIKVDVYPLRQVLDNYLPAGQVIDFMSIDVEGLDFQVLKSNDWNKYRPTYVLAEILGSSLHEIDQSDIGQFMRDTGYVLYAKCMNTVFFKESLAQ